MQEGLGFEGLRFEGLGFKGSGFEGLGFKGLGGTCGRKIFVLFYDPPTENRHGGSNSHAPV